MGTSLLSALGYYVPELLIGLTMLGLLLLEATYSKNEKNRGFTFVAALIGMVATLIFLFANLSVKPTAIFTNSLIIDPFSTFMKITMVLGGLGTIYLARYSKDIYEDFKTEYIVLTLGVILGGMLLASSNNFLNFYLGIEILSILSYVLSAMKKNHSRSSEAGLKYVLYGGIAAGIMLFGISHIYGILGTIQFSEIIPKLKFLRSTDVAYLMPAFLLVFVGIGFKISCAPFHMWTPDVYEGAPFPVTAFFAVVPKLAGMAGLVRLSFVFFEHDGVMHDSWVGLLHVVAALTMVVGNVTAMGQRSVKRMLAYSSIAHAGLMLLGVLVINDFGTRALLFYGVAYLFMTLVPFAITSFVADQYGNDHFERFNGLMKRYPLMSILMAISMFSLIGLPPFSGFVAKFNILSAVVAKEYYGLAIIAVLNSVVSLYYYMRIVRLMVFKGPESQEKIEGFNFLNHVVLTGLSLPILLLGIFWDRIMMMAQGARIFVP